MSMMPEGKELRIKANSSRPVLSHLPPQKTEMRIRKETKIKCHEPGCNRRVAFFGFCLYHVGKNKTAIYHDISGLCRGCESDSCDGCPVNNAKRLMA